MLWKTFLHILHISLCICFSITLLYTFRCGIADSKEMHIYNILDMNLSLDMTDGTTLYSYQKNEKAHCPTLLPDLDIIIWYLFFRVSS